MDWVFNCRILRVVDGDTIRVMTELGFKSYQQMNLRMAGVDTPEIFRGDEEERVAGHVAKDMVVDWINAHGDQYLVRTDKERNTFNRYVATHFWHEPSGDDLIDMLKEAGYGQEEA